MVTMLVGSALCLLLVPAYKVRRSDGSRIVPKPVKSNTGRWWQNFTQTARAEVVHILQLKDEPRVLFLVPMCELFYPTARS